MAAAQMSGRTFWGTLTAVGALFEHADTYVNLLDSDPAAVAAVFRAELAKREATG